MQATVISKLERLQKRLEDLNKVVIGFSGGIDSTLLLKIAVKTLGRDNVWAVTGNSESLLPEELDSCRDLAGEIGLRPENFIEIKTDELSNPDYRKNPIDRCFYCKSELFGRLNDIACEIGASVLDGSNADDLGDWRPGLKAASELGVISPLAEAG
ncbi:MAG: TIGR00268 family protein, partial [candidate division Zixibacteria bacterium]